MDKKVLEKVLEEFEYEIEYYADHTKRQYRVHVGDYLTFAGNRDWEDREVVRNYFEKLKKAGMSQSSINYVARGPLTALFRSHGLKLPTKLPRVRVSTDFTDRVHFSADEIIELIEVARASGDIQTQVVFAISTMYGPRAGEIIAIRKADIHPKRQTIVIHTEKEGFKREHLIPAQIQPYIFQYGYPIISQNTLSTILHNVASVAGVSTVPRKSYHAIRHGLVNALKYESGFANDKISQFTGWREGGMTMSYARPFPFMPELDNEILANHPFVKYWEGKK